MQMFRFLSAPVRELRRQRRVLWAAQFILARRADNDLSLRLGFYRSVLSRTIARGGDRSVTSQGGRLCRMLVGSWGLAYTRSPGSWALQVGPWIYTTEPRA